MQPANSRIEVTPEPAARTEVRPARLGSSAVLIAGLVVGLLAGAAGVGYALAAGRDDGPAFHEDLYLDYRVDPNNEKIKWADWASPPDTFLVIRFQSEPENVYVTPVVNDDQGFPNPQRLAIPRAFVPGEKAYVYLIDDDSASDKFWKDVTQKALKRGGVVVGRLASVWTLGQVPSEQVIGFCNEAGEKIGEMTLDANDCLAWTEFAVRSQVLSFEGENAKVETALTDADGQPAGVLSAVFGHREPPMQKR
ncbi:MAG: hypothetical protein KIS92_04565 [Planctomycetota bacterium]|nr:hypothetical protein [Planctomycetota bacterium]